MKTGFIATFAVIFLSWESYGQLTIQAGGTMTLHSATNSDISVKGDLVNNGAITGTGRVVLNGTTSQSINGNGDLGNLELNNASGAAIVSGLQSVFETFYPTSGVLTTNGGLRLRSNSSGTARVSAGTNGYLAGDVTLERYIPAQRGYRLLAHPFSSNLDLNALDDDLNISGTGGAANGFTTSPANNPSAFSHDPTLSNGISTAAWVPYTQIPGSTASNLWEPGEGLLLFIRGALGQGIGGGVYVPSDVTLDVTGPVNMGSFISVLSKLLGTSGWNLVVNPYPSQIEVSAIGNILNSAALGNSIVVYNPQGQPGNSYTMRGAYEVKTINDGNNGAQSFVLPSMGAFFIKTVSDGYSLLFTESCKTSIGPLSTVFKTTSGTNRIGVEIVDSSGHWDELLIQFDSTSSTSGSDVADVSKFKNDRLDFYSISSDNLKLAHDYRDLGSLISNSIIPLGLRVTVPKSYTIVFNELNLPSNLLVYLRDKVVNHLQPVSAGTQYTFLVTNDTSSQGNNRFELVFNHALASDDWGKDEMEILLAPNPTRSQIQVSLSSSTKANTKLELINMTGQILMEMPLGDVRSKSLNIDMSDQPTGLYLLKITHGHQYWVKKVQKL